MSLLFDRVCILGVGLIGGSIGMALRERKLAKQVVGVGRNADRLIAAYKLGAIDSYETDLKLGAINADLVIACSPVQAIPQQLCEAAAVASRNVLLTDVGSTKRTIVEMVDSLGLTPRFVGSHPMAGSDKCGVENAAENLFEGRPVIVTPISSTSESNLVGIESFWEGVGARTIRMSPEVHDESVAQISHLPHLLAAALAKMTPVQLLDITAGGWGSTTRVAAGDPELWQQIIQENRMPILEAIRDFSLQWREWELTIEQKDDEKLLQLLRHAQQTRSLLK